MDVHETRCLERAASDLLVLLFDVCVEDGSVTTTVRLREQAELVPGRSVLRELRQPGLCKVPKRASLNNTRQKGQQKKEECD